MIDKPHNVRMNGDFPVTVEKLVSSWLSLDPIALKWVHQLDHATSGTLCIALNKRAAAIASRSFVLRQVKKEYLAVLEGHLQMSSFPILEEESIGKLRDVFKSSLSLQQEIEGKKNTAEELPSKVPWTKRQRVDSPAQSSAGNVCSTQETSWQDEVKSANLRKCWDAFVELQNGIGNFRDNATVATLYNSLSSKSYQEFERNAKIRKNLRKLLKLCGKDLDLDPSQGEALPSAQAGADGNLISLDDLDVSEWRERYGNDSIDIGKQANNDLESIGGSISSVYRLTGDSPPNSILSSIQPSHDRLLILVPIRDSLSNDFRYNFITLHHLILSYVVDLE